MRIIKIICTVLASALLSAACGKSDGGQMFTIRNQQGMTAVFSPWGGRMVRLEVPSRDGSLKNVVWGLGDAEDCAADADLRQPVIGRFAGRIARGRFDLDGYTWQLPVNEGRNHLNGGPAGFDKREWTLQPLSDCSLLMTRLSPDGEEGYPGNLEISVLFTLTDQNELVVRYAARTDAPTILNPTQHIWFNLHGEGAGAVTSHILKINADAYIPVDAESIPTGEVAPVEGTDLDFRDGKAVAPQLDHHFVLRGTSGEPAAEVCEPASGIRLKIYTDQPGLQVCSRRPDRGLVLETQHFPDSPNHPEFPSTVLRPGETYTQNTIYRFEIL